MSDGTGKSERHRVAVDRERLVSQRDEARRERDALKAAIANAVRIHDGPRSVHYRNAIARVWEALRQTLRSDQ